MRDDGWLVAIREQIQRLGHLGELPPSCHQIGSTAHLTVAHARKVERHHVVVFGEKPYAEFEGDRKTLVFGDEEGLKLLRKFDAAGIPAVAVFLSGRPLWMNREINAADAFVAAWLPGSEGAGVADVLYGTRPATGRLGFSWPAACDGNPVNGREGALYSVGYGLSLTTKQVSDKLDETCGYLTAGSSSDWFTAGKLAPDIGVTAGGQPLPSFRGSAGGVVVRGIDYKRQEDAREVVFGAGSSLAFSQRQNGTGAYRIIYQLPARPAGRVTLTLGESEVDVTRHLALSAGKGWREMILTDACAPGLGKGITITSAAPMTMKIASVVREIMPPGADCSF